MKNKMLFVALIGIVSAQVPTGSIAGVVRDPSGAAGSCAQVKLVNLAANVVRTESNSEQGDYSFSQVRDVRPSLRSRSTVGVSGTIAEPSGGAAR